MRDIVVYATDTMADWEYGYLISGITMAEEMAPGRFRLRILADGGDHVTTKGGLRVLVDGSIGAVDPHTLAALVLPGADTWQSGHDVALGLAERALQAGACVAAICGATYGLARAGLLDDRAHTSNAADFLAPSGYRGAGGYQEARTVRDRGLITAPATMPVDFAAAVFRELALFPEPIVVAWYGLFTTGERAYFDILAGDAG
ncbi:MAG: DJ-1/PfpI family protein [Actinomycetales bacterium]